MLLGKHLLLTFSKLILNPREYKHTIIWHTGTIFIIISDDRPIGANGRSLQHLFGDEIRLVSYAKMKQSVFPAIRGERLRFGNVPQFQGVTFTTDMPDYQDADWLLERENMMDKEQIMRITQISIQYDLTRFELLEEESKEKKNKRRIRTLTEELSIFEKALNEKRMNSVLFDIASTLANVEALGLDAIKNMLARWTGKSLSARFFPFVRLRLTICFMQALAHVICIPHITMTITIHSV